MKKKGLALTIFSWLSIGTFASLILWVCWSLLWPFEVFSTKPGSWVVQNPGKHVARGAPLMVYLDYCVTLQESPRMDILIEQDGRILLLDPQYPGATIGCHKTVVNLVAIPKVLALESTTAAGTGKARLQVTLRYRINSLREVQYNFTTDEFFIDP